MRPPLLRAALLSLAAAAASIAAVRAEGDDAVGAKPRISFDRTSHDFGAVKQNSEVKTEFTVENQGTATLHVQSVRGDCGCANASISERELAPGGKATISVAFHTYTFVGPHKKHVRVSSDDPAKPDVDLDIAVDVSAGIVLEPANFFFDMALAGTSPTAKVVAKWKEGVGRPFRVTKVEAVGADVRFTTEPWDAPPWHGRAITMVFPKPPLAGIVTGRALISTDDPDVPQLTALVGGMVSGKVWLAQRVTSFGIVGFGKGASLEIPCHGFDATVDLGEVTAKARKGQVEAKAVRDPANPREWKIAIRLPPETKDGSVEDVVEVHTAVPGEETVEIQVTGTVMPKPT
jgi:hypothetical protein